MSDLVISGSALREFVFHILAGAGLHHSKARLLADSLVAANLRGVDSHGVQLLPFYMQQIEDRRVDPHAEGRVVSESAAILVYDGANGLGQVISEICCDHADRLAAAHGAGIVVARESNHFGAAAYWAQRISSRGHLGIVLCNASPMVAPWQGRDPRWGTNPICVSVPGPDGGGWLLDMATTTVAMGKIYKAHLTGQPSIPPGWAFDAEGVPTTETAKALHGLLMPLGGYKGSGLAMMVEILCGVLSGGAISTELGGLRKTTQPFRVSQFFLALDVTRFMPPEEFAARMRRLIAMVRSSRPAPGYDDVLVAGEPEWRHEAVRSVEGIPIPAAHWQGLCELAARYHVHPPVS